MPVSLGCEPAFKRTSVAQATDCVTFISRNHTLPNTLERMQVLRRNGYIINQIPQTPPRRPKRPHDATETPPGRPQAPRRPQDTQRALEDPPPKAPPGPLPKISESPKAPQDSPEPPTDPPQDPPWLDPGPQGWAGGAREAIRIKQLMANPPHRNIFPHYVFQTMVITPLTTTAGTAGPLTPHSCLIFKQLADSAPTTAPHFAVIISG